MVDFLTIFFFLVSAVVLALLYFGFLVTVADSICNKWIVSDKGVILALLFVLCGVVFPVALMLSFGVNQHG
jgi:hypothetical protein